MDKFIDINKHRYVKAACNVPSVPAHDSPQVRRHPRRPRVPQQLPYTLGGHVDGARAAGAAAELGPGLRAAALRWHGGHLGTPGDDWG